MTSLRTPRIGAMARSLPLTAVLAALGLATGAGAVAQAAPAQLSVVNKIPGPDGIWDYVSADPAHHRIYIAHGQAVTSIDTQTNQLTPVFAPGGHVHAVVPIPDSNILLTTNADDGTARFIDEDTGAVLGSVPTGKKPDAATFDPVNKLAIVVDGDLGDLYFIDVPGRRVVDKLHLVEGLEYAVPDGKGRLFVNASDAKQVIAVDIKARKIVARYPLKGCEEPTSLAYVSKDRLISVCANLVAKILDAKTGHDIANLKIGGYPDAVIYDAKRQLAYVPTGESGTLTVIGLEGPKANKVVATLPTQTGARTGTIDPTTGRLYLPTATYPTPPKQGKRTPTTPGTFTVLVMDRK